MKLDKHQVERPFRKLRKLLAGAAFAALPEEVHTLRTQARRLEAVISAATVEHSRQFRRLIESITALRKAAGRVRDMDVLIGDALSLAQDTDRSALVEFVEHLARVRLKRARKLSRLVERHRGKTRRRLKRCSRLIKDQVQHTSPAGENAATESLVSELRLWPELAPSNLHHFRIRAKELRYILQLAPHPDHHSLEPLDKAKDTIGDWHDWTELLRFARKAFGKSAKTALLRRIDAIQRQKLDEAIASANQVRGNFLDPSSGGGPRPTMFRKVASF